MTNDFAKMFDPQEIAQNFTKMMDMSAFKDMPKMWPDMKATAINMNGIDLQQLTAAHQKNVEAFTQAHQVAMAGMQTLMRRQGDIVRLCLEQCGTLARDSVAAGTPEEKLARQAGLVKQVFEATTQNMRELATLVAESQNETLRVLNERIAEGLDDIQAAVAANTPKPKRAAAE